MCDLKKVGRGLAGRIPEKLLTWGTAAATVGATTLTAMATDDPVDTGLSVSSIVTGFKTTVAPQLIIACGVVLLICVVVAVVKSLRKNTTKIIK